MSQRVRFLIDKSAIGLSGLCLVHCLFGSLALAVLSAGGSGLFGHDVHKTGLALAIPLAIFGLGRGIMAHRRWIIVAVGGVGIGFMAMALAMEHGATEALLTMIGVVLVAAAHILNIRWLRA
jgi:hypothetical protein